MSLVYPEGAELLYVARAANAGVTGVRLLAAGEPTPAGFVLVVRGDGLRVALTPAAAVTAAVTTAVTAADLSDAAAKLRDDARNPERTALRESAALAVTDINTYLAAADSGTAAQIQARDHQAVKRLAQMVKALILRTVQLD